MTIVAGVFDQAQDAQRALRTLLNHHFDVAGISVLAADHGEMHEVPLVHRTGIGRSAALGAAVGSVLGGALVATGFFVGPWMVVGAGPILATLGGAMAGAATGTAYGAFAGMGFWSEAADLHAEALQRGAIWVGVLADGREDDAEAALHEAGARDVARAEPGIHRLLHQDHEHLDSLIGELEAASAEGRVPDAFGALWSRLGQEVQSHLAAEEEHLFPHLAGSHPDEVAELLEDHRRIRERLRRTDVPGQQDLRDILQILREHALREDRTVSPWADLELGGEASQLLERIREVIRSRRSVREPA